MKVRYGFVSNSSSASYIIYYKPGALIQGAKNIREYIEQNPGDSLTLLGAELSEGHDYTELTPAFYKLIRMFPERWDANGDSVSALVDRKNLYYMDHIRTLWDSSAPEGVKELVPDPPDSSYTLSMTFEKDNSRYFDEESLEEFYRLYFMQDSDFDEDEVDPIDSPFPYAISFRARGRIENRSSREDFINTPSNFPVLISRGIEDEDIIRTLTAVDDYPGFTISFREYFLVEYPCDLYLVDIDKLTDKNVEIFTCAKIIRNDEQAFIRATRVLPMFGSYVFRRGVDKI